MAIDELGDRQRVKQLDIAQATATRLQIGLGAVGDAPAARPTVVGHVDEFVHPRTDSAAPLAAYAVDQARRELLVPDDVAGFQHAQRGRHVGTGHTQGIRDGAHTVVQPNVGVPQWIPQRIGDIAQFLDGFAVVQQHQIQVRIRQQLAPAEPADPDDRITAVIGDPDLRGLDDQPGLMQIQPRLPQLGRIHVAMIIGQQLAPRGSQIACRADTPRLHDLRIR